MQGKLNRIYKYFFYDKSGNFVLWQFPNVPLLIWLIFRLLSFFNILSDLNYFFDQISTGFLFIWSYLELTQGVNNFRKVLGLVVLVFLIIGSY
jgi:hypothetical protein